MIINNLSALKINKLTQEQYDRLVAEDLVKEDELYLIPDPVTVSAPITWRVFDDITLQEDVASVTIPYDNSNDHFIRILIKPPAAWTPSNLRIQFRSSLSNTSNLIGILNATSIATHGVWIECEVSPTMFATTACFMGSYLWLSSTQWASIHNRTIPTFTELHMYVDKETIPTGTQIMVMVKE